jgi:small subunit ribosomal protein S1
VGQKIKGDVTNITEFGVFIDLGGVEGLIHISELSWGRVVHPADIVSLGENLEVMVIDVSPERCRVALSLKRLQPNPWETVRDRYLINDIVPATVTTIVSFGAFARLEEGLEGLIHVSEIQLENGKTLKEILTPGSKINVRILQVDSAHQRLGLSLKLEEK